MTSIGVSNEAIHGNVAAAKKADGVDALVKETTKLSIASNGKERAKPLAYTSEELQTIQTVYDKLTTTEKVDPNKIGLRALALTTIVLSCE